MKTGHDSLLSSSRNVANGGAERCLLDLVKGLKQARESWEIYVVFPAKDELWEMALPYLSGYAFIRQPWWLVRPKKRNWRKRLLFNLKKSSAIRKTRDYIREIKPDITITNTLATPSSYSFQAENIPRLVHSRNSGISPKPDLSILRR